MKVELKDYNVMINEQNLLDQPVKSDLRRYDNIRKIATGLGDYYTTGCLLGYAYFKENYKLIATDLRKQQTLDTDPKAVHQIYFTGNLDRSNNTAIFFMIEEAKETILDYS